MNSGKAAFKLLSDKLKAQLPFCLHYEWWEEVVQSDWEVAFVGEGKDIKAVWPYMLRKKGPWKMICQPPFTPYGGPIFNYPEDQKLERRYSWEQKVVKELIEELGEYSELLINCRIDLQNTLPFIWEGFEDKKKFTYVQDLQQAEEDLWAGFRENIRRQIRKGEKELTVSSSSDAQLMGELLQQSFVSQEESYPIEDESIYLRILNYLHKHNCGEFLQARDQEGEVHAMIVWIHDSFSAYYLIGGSALKHKNSGAMSLLLWEAIKRSQKSEIRKQEEISDSQTHRPTESNDNSNVRLSGVEATSNKQALKYFNFEGSMIPSVEKYLRGFGGELTPYSCLINNRSNSLKVLRKLKG